ncbi:MAG TPA: type III pantothenate kinase, partial [Actinobacteria bacterium]|nr:type III pantothenate kinase [Actinomycetota bacterium]
MLLVIDVGNTETALGLYSGGGTDRHWRVATRYEETADEKAYQVANLIGLAGYGLTEIKRNKGKYS